MAPRKRYKVLTEQQHRACILKVESGLNDAAIAREVGITPQGVARWWKLDHVKRELGRQAERYSVDVLPELVQEFREIRDITIKKLRANLEGTVTIREANDTIRTMTATLENEIAKLDAARIAAQDHQTVESITDALEPLELDALARRLAGMTGKKRLMLVDEIPVVEIEV